MDRLLSITINCARDNRPYSFTLPYGAAYEEVFDVLKNIVDDLKDYQEMHQKQQDQQESSTVISSNGESTIVKEAS